MEAQRTWTRWHADGWVLKVLQDQAGAFFYTAQQDGAPEVTPVSATGLADAQHRAEDTVRNSGHRCVARCSFWIPDQPDDE